MSELGLSLNRRRYAPGVSVLRVTRSKRLLGVRAIASTKALAYRGAPQPRGYSVGLRTFEMAVPTLCIPSCFGTDSSSVNWLQVE